MNVASHDCCTLDTSPGNGVTSFEVARQRAAGLARPHGRVEEVPLSAVRGRVLARDILAPGPLPPFDQAAMDGYAIRHGERMGMPLLLPVAGRTDAGAPRARLMPGTAHRIMTGAAVPERADTIVMQEHVVRRGNLVRIDGDLPANTHIRMAGEDVARGARVLPAGHRLDWAGIGMLAALGIASVAVAERVRVVILVTGNELRGAGADLSAGMIHDINGPMLAALLSDVGTDVVVRRIGDDPIALSDALRVASQEADIVATTGGMAFGVKDHVRAAVAEAGGRLAVTGVAMKPGKPLGLGRIGEACFIGLPGNPQACAFAALAFIRPMIAEMAGDEPMTVRRAALAFSCHPKPGRTELVPVRLDVAERHIVASRCGPEGSHRMMPMIEADGLAVISEPAEPGVAVEIIPFDKCHEW